MIAVLRRVVALGLAGGVMATGVAACGSPAGQTSGAAATSATARPSPSPSQSGMQAAQVVTAPQHVLAEAGALADVSMAKLLWGRLIGTERPIGSIAKVMTTLVVLQAGGMNRQIRIPRAAVQYVAKYQGESAGLRPGDVLTVNQLLEAMLLQSACDAAYVLAMTYGPGMPAFLAKMNAMAVRLGMSHTHFSSPDGLPYPTEYSTYSTPIDLIALGLAAMKVPLFRSIVAQRFYNLPKSRGLHRAYWWNNTDSLIGSYQGAIGIKTGYTDAAKHCLLFEAVRHGTTLIGVVLGSPDTGPDAGAQAAARLLDWGFSLKLGTAG